MREPKGSPLTFGMVRSTLFSSPQQLEMEQPPYLLGSYGPIFFI